MKTPTKLFKIFCLTLTFLCFLARPGYAQADKSMLSVSGEVLKPLSLTVDDLAKLPPLKVKTKDRDNNEREYSGASVFEVLKAAGVTLGAELRGENMAKYVVITAADNYQVVYALAEFDPDFTSDVVLLAWAVDGKPLPKGEGPFRLVNPSDKKHARWIREIKSIKVQFARD